MKKIALYIGIAVAAIGCAKDNIVDPTSSSGGAISFSAAVESDVTRVSVDDDCAWEVNDAIGIFTNIDSDTKNMLFNIVSDDAENPDNANLVTLGKMEGSDLYAYTERTYYVYYPRTTDSSKIDTAASTLAISQSQSDPLLWATQGPTQSTEVKFTFTHMLPKVTFNLSAGGNDVTSLDEVTSATLKGANAKATFNIESGKFFDPVTGDITLAIEDSKIIAYLPPMEKVKEGNVTLWITAQGNTFYYPITTESWESGTSYEYEIVVGNGLPVIDYSSADTVNSLLVLDESNTDLRLSNCYMVDPAVYGGTIIPVGSRINTFWTDSDYGNYNSSLSIDSDKWVDDDAYTIEELWCDFSGSEGITFEKVTGDDGNPAMKIKFAVGFSSVGNMVVAVKKSGTILWSWHIWLTDYNPYTKSNGTTYKIYSNDVLLTWMDRNIGARDTEYNSSKTGVLYYQWGRKDPIRSNATAMTVATTIADVVKSPTYFYKSAYDSGTSTSDFDWCGSDTDWDQDRDHHWRDAKLASVNDDTTKYGNTKSIYDPSPLGFMVPCSTATDSWNSPFNFVSDSGYSFTTNGFGGDNGIFFPAYGWRIYYDGSSWYYGDRSYYWSAAAVSSSNKTSCYGLNFYSGNTYYTIAARAGGVPVRPIKEF
ncbi:MAG: fimbrillin family protein [Rikenellaceae bacterium]